MQTWGAKVDLPPGEKATNTQFLLTRKKVGGKIMEKARLVFKNSIYAGGGSIFEEVYSPVVDKVSLRLFFALTAMHSLFLRSFDVKTAFLNAEIDESKYIRLPQQFFMQEGIKVRKLKKALYGYIRDPRLWNQVFAKEILSYGFVQCSKDPCLFFHVNRTMLIIYVDDGAISGPNLHFVEFILDRLSSKFRIKNMGHPDNFLGMEIQYEQKTQILTLSQRHYIAGIIEKFGI
jgi:hypothetical protein